MTARTWRRRLITSSPTPGPTASDGPGHPRRTHPLEPTPADGAVARRGARHQVIRGAPARIPGHQTGHLDHRAPRAGRPALRADYPHRRRLPAPRERVGRSQESAPGHAPIHAFRSIPSPGARCPQPEGAACCLYTDRHGSHKDVAQDHRVIGRPCRRDPTDGSPPRETQRPLTRADVAASLIVAAVAVVVTFMIYRTLSDWSYRAGRPLLALIERTSHLTSAWASYRRSHRRRYLRRSRHVRRGLESTHDSNGDSNVTHRADRARRYRQECAAERPHPSGPTRTDTEEVTDSIPVPPTSRFAGQREYRSR